MAAVKRHVPKSTSDASRTGMVYMPREAVTPRDTAFTHTDNLPQAMQTIAATLPVRLTQIGDHAWQIDPR